MVKKNKLVTIGHHPDAERQVDDYYATEPKAFDVWPAKTQFSNVWEPAVGGGHIAKEMEKIGILSRVSDIVDRGYPKTEIIDFLHYKGKWSGDIITNPPFKLAAEFINKAMEILEPNRKLALFMPIRYLEGIKRYKSIKKYPPKEIWCSVKRLTCAKNGDPEIFAKGSATAYAWFVWEKGFNGNPQVFWFNDK